MGVDRANSNICNYMVYKKLDPHEIGLLRRTIDFTHGDTSKTQSHRSKTAPWVNVAA